jgi:hypothetical protein
MGSVSAVEFVNYVPSIVVREFDQLCSHSPYSFDPDGIAGSVCVLNSPPGKKVTP